MDQLDGVRYIRFSTDNQDAESQRYLCHKLESGENRFNLKIHITEEIIDEGLSGVDPTRPGLLKLQEWVKNNPGKAVVISEKSRLGRDDSQLIRIGFEALCASCNVKLISSDIEISDTGLNNVIQYLHGYKAAQERKDIQRRMEGGKLAKLTAGDPILARVPYGYTYVLKTGKGKAGILVNDEEAQVVRRIFEMYAQGKSIRSIAIQLTTEKIPTQKSKAGWERSTINGILRRDTYATGFVYYGKSKSLNSKTPQRKTIQQNDRSKWISLPVPTIIDKTLFEKAQQRLVSNLSLNPRNVKYDYLLSHLLFCGLCGRPYSSYTSNYGQRFARCTSRDHLDAEGNRTWCKNRAIKLNTVEDYIWQMVKLIVHNPQELFKQYDALKEPTQKRIEELKSELQIVEKKESLIQSKFMEMMREFNNGRLTLERWNQYQEVTDKQKEAYASRGRELVSEIQKLQETLTRLDDSRELYATTRIFEDLDALSFTEKQKLVRQFIKRINISPEKHKYVVDFTVPVPGKPTKNNMIQPFDKPKDKVNIRIQARKLAYSPSSFKNTCITDHNSLNFSMNVDLTRYKKDQGVHSPFYTYL